MTLHREQGLLAAQARLVPVGPHQDSAGPASALSISSGNSFIPLGVLHCPQGDPSPPSAPPLQGLPVPILWDQALLTFGGLQGWGVPSRPLQPMTVA